MDEKGERIVREGQNVAEIRPVAIYCIDEEVREMLRKEYDKAELLTLMVLWRRRNEGLDKLGIQTFEPVIPGAPRKQDFDEWEKKAVSFYLQRKQMKEN